MSAEPLTTTEVERIVQHWNPAEDGPVELTTSFLPRFDHPCKPHEDKKFPLPDDNLRQAQAYIMALLKPYPYQCWRDLGSIYWHRYLDVYSLRGDHLKAMVAI